MKRLLPMLCVSVVLLWGCSTSPMASVAVPTMSASPVTSSPEAITEKYRVTAGTVSLESASGSADPVVHYLYSGTLLQDGSMVHGDGEALFPNSGAMMHDTTQEQLKEMLREDKPLLHDGSVRVLMTGGIVSNASYSIYDSDFNQLESFREAGTIPLKENSEIQLSKEKGVYFICIVVNWLAKELYSAESGREYVGNEYVFLVRYDKPKN